MKRIHNEKGFTLIELMATLAILALIVLIAVPAVGSIINNAGDSAEASSIKMIENAGALASIDSLDYDGSVTGEGYEVATLIDEGYLDLDRSDDLVSGYVVREGAGNNFVYNGSGDDSGPGIGSGNSEPIEMVYEDDDVEAEDIVEGVASGEALLDLVLNADGASYSVLGLSDAHPAAVTDIVIPSEYNGLPVTAIKGYNVAAEIDWDGFSDSGLTSVVIPEGIVEIGHSAFHGNNLSTVDIPDSVKRISHVAFSSNNLTDVSFGDGLERIGMTSFAHNSLTDVVMPDSMQYIGQSAFIGNVGTVDISVPGHINIHNNNPGTNFTVR